MNSQNLEPKQSDVSQTDNSQYLGEGYRQKLRKMLTVGTDILPDSVIDAEYNIEATKVLMGDAVLKMQQAGEEIDKDENLQTLSQIAVYYLAAILCMAMKSKSKVAPYNIPKYKKNWDKKRKNYMDKGNKLMVLLMKKVGVNTVGTDSTGLEGLFRQANITK